MKRKNHFALIGQAGLVGLVLAVTICDPCMASLESSLRGLRSTLTTVILPVVSVMGLVLASMSLYTGNPQAKQHIVYAIIGCAFGFGAQAIVDLISQTVR